MPLTDTAARNAKPSAKPYKLTDGAGLYLEVMPTGARYWRMRYRYGGRDSRVAFGVYPEVTLAEARKRRDEARAALREARTRLRSSEPERRPPASLGPKALRPSPMSGLQSKRLVSRRPRMQRPCG